MVLIDPFSEYNYLFRFASRTIDLSVWSRLIHPLYRITDLDIINLGLFNFFLIIKGYKSDQKPS